MGGFRKFRKIVGPSMDGKSWRVDITKILVADPPTAEEAFKVAQKGLRSGVDLVVIR